MTPWLRCTACGLRLYECEAGPVEGEEHGRTEIGPWIFAWCGGTWVKESE